MNAYGNKSNELILLRTMHFMCVCVCEKKREKMNEILILGKGCSFL